MFKTSLTFSLVTAVLPDNRTREVIPALLGQAGTDALSWRARGTLLQDHWWKRWLPPIMPTKNILQMLAPSDDVDKLIATIVEYGRLHQQATGAVFSTPCDHAYFGSEFDTWPVRDAIESGVQPAAHKLTENLSVIYCIVGPNYTERVSKAAITSGAHGPIVYYSEGRGLRDRLGWLRITKEHEKTVLMIIADETDADDIFDAMALAGELHLPGRGFMYRMNIDKGMFNLPSRVSHHHYEANMQQIIHAIDHLSGHTHWRDQSVFNVGGGRGVGLDNLKTAAVQLENQVALSAIATREHCAAVMDMLLDAGAPGLNITYGRYTGREVAEHIAGAQLNEEYGLLRCITDSVTAQKICATVDAEAETQGLRDFCMFVNNVPQVATYVPGKIDYREPVPLAS